MASVGCKKMTTIKPRARSTHRLLDGFYNYIIDNNNTTWTQKLLIYPPWCWPVLNHHPK